MCFMEIVSGITSYSRGIHGGKNVVPVSIITLQKSFSVQSDLACVVIDQTTLWRVSTPRIRCLSNATVFSITRERKGGNVGVVGLLTRLVVKVAYRYLIFAGVVIRVACVEMLTRREVTFNQMVIAIRVVFARLPSLPGFLQVGFDECLAVQVQIGQS
jgi:hypothetical protein